MIGKSIVGLREKVQSKHANETERTHHLLLSLILAANLLVFLDYNSERLTGACSTLHPNRRECMAVKRVKLFARYRLE